MLSITFLGHQGWLVRSRQAAVLVDPLLTERFGHGGRLGRVFPPRRVDPAAFPPVDAVLLTHEHDDHFDIPSLHRLDRRIPILMSRRSSVAARELLEHMGFVARPLRPHATVELGDLRLHGFVPDRAASAGADEWDVVPFALWHADGHGSVVSSVDVALPEAMPSRLRALGVPAGLWCYASNLGSAAHQVLPPPPPGDDDGPRLAAAVLRRLARLREGWCEPLATLVCGAGWSFDGDRSWIDHHAFPVSPERLAERLREHGELAHAPAPGDTVVMEGGRVVGRHVEPFVEALPPEHWPSRIFDGQPPPPREFSPATERSALAPGELDELRDRLEDFAAFLYGGEVFRSLCALPTTIDGRAGAWGLRLLDDGGPVALRHAPERCAFVPTALADPRGTWLSGLELWATDLLALLRGTLAPSALCYAGRLRVWNHRADVLRVSPHLLWVYGHPLRRPEAAATLYRMLLEAEPVDVPRVPARTPT